MYYEPNLEHHNFPSTELIITKKWLMIFQGNTDSKCKKYQEKML